MADGTRADDRRRFWRRLRLQVNFQERIRAAKTGVLWVGSGLSTGESIQHDAIRRSGSDG